MRIPFGKLAGAIALLLLTSPVAFASEPTGIAIGGPPPWPETSLTLEVGSRSALLEAGVSGGVTSIDLDDPAVVRVRRVSDCVPLVRFLAQPGRSYSIEFTSNGRLRVEDRGDSGLDSGPGFDLTSGLMCPALPDTSTQGATPGQSSGPLLAIFLIMLSVSMCMLPAARWVQRH